MKIEELELVDKILPKGSLWTISSLRPSLYYEDAFNIVLKFEKIEFVGAVHPNLKIAELSTNLLKIKHTNNAKIINVDYDFCGIYLSLYEYLTTNKCEDGIFTKNTIKKTINLLIESGGPKFKIANNRVSFLNQSDVLFESQNDVVFEFKDTMSLSVGHK